MELVNDPVIRSTAFQKYCYNCNLVRLALPTRARSSALVKQNNKEYAAVFKKEKITAKKK